MIVDVLELLFDAGDAVNARPSVRVLRERMGTGGTGGTGGTALMCLSGNGVSDDDVSGNDVSNNGVLGAVYGICMG